MVSIKLVWSQADHSMHLRLCETMCETKRIYEGHKLSSENCTSKSLLGLNILIKLNETLINWYMVFFHLLGMSKASYSEITFGLRCDFDDPHRFSSSQTLFHINTNTLSGLLVVWSSETKWSLIKIWQEIVLTEEFNEWLQFACRYQLQSDLY